jgi:RNA polymerase sigma-70 factor, ECF subfamily
MTPEEPEHEAARLYDSYGASLYRYALMILSSREAAEDVIQQVFIVLLDRGTGHIEDEERYLRRAVRNACYSALRQTRVRAVGSYPLDDALLEVVASTEQPVVSPEERLALDTAITQLPTDQREVLHLHAFEGLTFREIAAATGEPLNTIASRYRYALDKLRTTLTEAKP